MKIISLLTRGIRHAAIILLCVFAVPRAASSTATPSAMPKVSETGQAQDASTLIDLLAHGTPDSREKAAKALDRLHWQPQTDAEKVMYLMAKGDEDEVFRMGSRATVGLSNELRSEHDSTRLYAARMLGQIADPAAIPVLVHALADEWDWVSQAAAEALDRLNWQPSTDADKVAYFLAKEDWSRLVGLGQSAVSSLIHTLTGRNTVKEKGAASALGQIGDRQAVQALIEALESKRCLFRAEAATALGEIGDSRAIRPLYDALKNDNYDLRYAASIALGRLGPSARNLIIEALHDSDPAVRECAARALGTSGDPNATGELITALKDSQPAVRRVAAWALGTIGDKSAFDPLIGILRDKDPHVRDQTASALQRVDKQRYSRWMAWQTTKRYGGPGVIIIFLIACVLALIRREAAEER